MGRSYFHLHLVSDSTGETLIAASRAAAAQYQGVASIEHVYPLVRTPSQLDRVIAEIENAPGIVLFTLVDSDLSRRLEASCEASGSPCLSVLEPDPDPVPVLSRPELDAASRRAAHAQRRILQADRRAQFHHDERRRSGAGEPRTRRHRAHRSQPHVEDARPASISPIVATRPPTFRWCRMSPCRGPSTICGVR